MPNKRGSTPLILLLVVLIIAAIAGAFYFGTKKGSVSNLTPTIEIVNPKSPSTFKKGDEVLIEWKAENLPSNSHVVLSLGNEKNSTGGYITILNSTETSYKWSAGLIITGDTGGELPAGEYSLKIILYDNNPCANIVGMCAPGTQRANKISESNTISIKITN